MKTTSLTQQTVGLVLIAQMLSAFTLCSAALTHERHTRFRAFDTQLLGRSDSLLGSTRYVDDPDRTLAIDSAEFKLPSRDVYAVYNLGGHILGSSENAPAALIARGSDGFRDVRVGGSQYRVLQRQVLRFNWHPEAGGVGSRSPVTIVYAAPEAHVWHEIFEAARFYLIIILVAAIGTGFFVAVLLRRTLRPLSELADAAAGLAPPALKFEPPHSALQTRELRPLTDVLTESVARLRESFAREHRFVGDAAHELKTAIAVVRSSVQVLMLKRRTGEEYSAGLNRILEDTQRVETLVTQMLQLARLEESEQGNTPVLDLNAIVHSVATLLEPVASARGLRIDIDGAPGSCVRLPPESAEILVSNLLLNAIQHSKPGALIRICVKPNDSESIGLEIIDEGDGIGPEALPHIFERFYREDTSRSRETGGTGLGLAICKSITDAANGSIGIESERNVGTTVKVIFTRFGDVAHY